MSRPTRILHLEDDPRDADIVRCRLEAAGIDCVVTVVDTRADYEETLRTRPFDILLCDYNLQDYDGLSALRYALEWRPQLPVILISGILDEEDAVACLREGAADYVHKGRLQRLAPAVERALKESLRRTQMRSMWEILEATPDMITMCDLDGILVYANPAARRMLGLQPNGPLPQQPLAGTAMGRADLRSALASDLHTGTWHGESERTDVYGHRIPVSEVQIAHLGASGTVRFISSIARDISEQRRTLQAMRDNEELFRAILIASPMAGVLCDESGRIVISNPVADGLFGRSLLDARINELLPAWVVAESAVNGLATDSRYIETDALRADGIRFPAAYAFRHVISAGRRFVLFLLYDLTEMKSLERQLRQSQTLEAIGQLSGGLAHDFNNLLGVVIGNLDLLEPAVRNDPAATRWLESALAAALSGAELTQRMLTVARKQSLAPTAVDLHREFDQIMPLIERSLHANIEIALALEDGLPPVLVDPSALQNAILNLAINARDAMPEGGLLSLKGTAVHLEAEDARLASPDLAPGDYVQLQICDTGHGIAQELLDRVFEPFFTTKEPGRGTGLGLAMVYGFIKQSRGHIKIYSEPGHGTSVKILLPVAVMARSGGPDTSQPQSKPANPAGLHVLVVDDRRDVAEVAGSYLQQMGHSVRISHSPAEALAWLREGTRIDLVVSDIVMPGGIDGFELRRQAMQIVPGLPFVFVSGFSQEALEHGNGADIPVPVVSKPFRRRELEDALRRATGTGARADQV